MTRFLPRRNAGLSGRAASDGPGRRVLITGATGTVGHPIARRLSARGDEVGALVRDPGRARDLLPEGVEPVAGDVTDAATVDAAIAAQAGLREAVGDVTHDGGVLHQHEVAIDQRRHLAAGRVPAHLALPLGGVDRIREGHQHLVELDAELLHEDPGP